MSKSKLDLRHPIFNNENAAREHLECLLWPNGGVCPRCQGQRVTKLEGKSTRPGVYKCKDCRKPFSVTVGTVMERSKIPLTKWLLAAQLMASSKKGMSALQLQRMLSVTYETAWFLFHRLREAATSRGDGPLGGQNKVIEADETYIGGKEHNKHAHKRIEGAQGGTGKQAVLTLVERDGNARSFHVANVTGATIRPIMVKHASRKSHL
ncbi:MAG: IS1595 family transposase, partial [Sphingomonadales bacterium]